MIGTIEKNVPIPKRLYEMSKVKSKYRFCDMEIGDSFGVSDDNVDIKTLIARVRGAVDHYYTIDNQKVFSVRKITNRSVRVWRIK